MPPRVCGKFRWPFLSLIFITRNFLVEPAPLVVKKTPVKSSAKRAIKEDTIADDVRKIKESLKEPKPTPAKKVREPKSTPTTSRSRASKKEEKVEKEQVKEVEEKPKPMPVNELKNELLADWDDDDDEDYSAQKSKVEGEFWHY